MAYTKKEEQERVMEVLKPVLGIVVRGVKGDREVFSDIVIADELIKKDF